ncbi:MAG: AbrB/MazE/SpoVT family DNA-binding domain-containing protein [Candidatus Paceibacterota bacterium]
MTRKIIKIGTSQGVTIPKDIRKELNLKVGDELQVDFSKEKQKFSFKISNRKAKNKNKARRDRIAKLTTNFIDRYREDLESLFDK